MNRESSVADTVKTFILNEFLPGEDSSNLTPTTPLVSSGILDSLAMLKLITFIQQEFNVQIEAYEADEEHFNTVAAISALIHAKSG